MSKQSIETSRNQFLCMTGKQKLSNAYNSYFSIWPNISNSFNINLTQLNKKNQKSDNDWLIATKLKWKIKIVIRTINKLSKSQSRHIVSCRSKGPNLYYLALMSLSKYTLESFQIKFALSVPMYWLLILLKLSNILVNTNELNY